MKTTIIISVLGVLALGCTSSVYVKDKYRSAEAILATVVDESDFSIVAIPSVESSLQDVVNDAERRASKTYNKLSNNQGIEGSGNRLTTKVQSTNAGNLVRELNSINYNNLNMSSIQILHFVVKKYGSSALRTAATSLGDPASMWILARDYELGLYSPRNSTESLRLLRLSCSKRFGGGCNNYGSAFLGGKNGVSKNYYEAVKWFNLACSYNSAWGCDNLGQMYFNGWGVQQSYRTAYSLMSKACHMGTAVRRACYREALMHEEGYGTPRNYEQAVSHMRMACNLSHPNACTKLGVYYYLGMGVGRNIPAAKHYVGIGCDLGDAKGCEWVRILQSRS